MNRWQTMVWRRSAVSLAILFLCAPAFANESPDSGSSHFAPPLAPVVVVTEDGAEYEGTLHRISADTIQVYSESAGVYFLTLSEVKTVHPTERAGFKYAVLGATFAVVGVFLLDRLTPMEPSGFQADRTVYVAMGTIGLLFGGVIGHNTRYCDYRHDMWDDWKAETSAKVSIVLHLGKL